MQRRHERPQSFLQVMEFTNNYIDNLFEKYYRKKKSHRREKWKKCSILVDLPYWTSATISFKCDASGKKVCQIYWQLINTEGKPKRLLRLVRIYKKCMLGMNYT